MYENSVTYQFVGNVAGGLATGASVTGLPEGGVAIIDAAGNAVDPAVDITAAGGATPIRVATRINGVLKQSPIFRMESAEAVEVPYVAPVEQVTFVGYNGTDGALDTDIDATYIASVQLTNSQGVYNNTPIIKTVSAYLPNDATLSNSELGQAEHALRLTNSFNTSFSEARLGGKVIVAERVNDGTQTAVPTGTTDFTFTKGSVSFSSTDIDDDTGTAALAVGDLIVIGDAATSPVYKIATIDTGNNVGTLDAPFQGESATFEDGDLSVVTVANQDDSNWGVRLTGATPASFNPITDSFPRQIRFEVSYTKTFRDPANVNNKIISVATAPITTTVAANDGVGSAAEIAKFETYANMNEQNHIVSHYPPTRYVQSVVSTNTYDQLVISAVEDRFVDVATGKRPISTFNIRIATEVTLDHDTMDTILGTP